MKTYTISEVQTVLVTAQIEAESEDEAREKWMDGLNNAHRLTREVKDSTDLTITEWDN